MMIQDIMETQYTKVIYQEQLIIIFGFQKILILMNIRVKNQVKTQNSIVNLKVETQILLIKVGEYQYDLYMRMDTNTKGHRQWFYFSIRNLKKQKIKINIYRFKKQYSLYQRGMKPYIRSIKSDKGWLPGGQRVKYQVQKKPSDQLNYLNPKKKMYYLTFQYTFQHEQDEVFFAAGLPYTYTYLENRLKFYENIVTQNNLKLISFQSSTLVKSMCGLNVPLLTIQKNKRQSYLDQTNTSNPQEKERRFIIINARTHSGQSSASWVLDGLLEQICNSKSICKWIYNENIVIKIVPMLNPDGVFIGNYRTGIIGDDFNRKFLSAKKQFFPEIHALRKLVSSCKKMGTVELFLDLHGHSVLKNSFIYGPHQEMFSSAKLKSLPYYLWQHSKYFRLSSCKFKFEKDLIQTARVFFQMKQSVLSYTCQNSLGLYYQQRQTFQMLQSDWKSFGSSIISGVHDIFTSKLKYHSVIIQQLHITKNQYKAGNAPEKIGQNSEQSPRRKKNQITQINEKQESSKQLHKQIINYNRHESFVQNKQYSPSPKKLYIKNVTQIHPHENLRKNIPYAHNSVVNYQSEKRQLNKTKFNIRKKYELMKRTKPEIQTNLYATDKEIKKQIQKKDLFQFIKEQRSITCDQSYLNDHINKLREMQSPLQQKNYNDDLQKILETFSEDYVSINDSDSSSDDLSQKQKNYLLQQIKAARHIKTHFSSEEQDEQKEYQINNQNIDNLASNINGFREIRFKSYEQYAHKHSLPNNNILPKQNKKEPHKFRQFLNRSMKCRNQQQSEFQMINISQKKKIVERVSNKSFRQQSFLVKIRNSERQF